MSISQIESKIKSLQSEIARLNKAYTDEAKKECGYLTSASRTQKSITKNTSPSMLKTKLKSISSDSEKAEKSRKKQAELQEKAAKKKTELAKQQALLQKEQDKVFQEMTKRQNEALNNQRKLVEGTEKMQEEIGTKESVLRNTDQAGIIADICNQLIPRPDRKILYGCLVHFLFLLLNKFTAEEETQIFQLKQDNKLDEVFRILFLKQCNALNEILPALFEKTKNYTELLLSLSVIDQDTRSGSNFPLSEESTRIWEGR